MRAVCPHSLQTSTYCPPDREGGPGRSCRNSCSIFPGRNGALGGAACNSVFSEPQLLQRSLGILFKVILLHGVWRRVCQVGINECHACLQKLESMREKRPCKQARTKACGAALRKDHRTQRFRIPECLFVSPGKSEKIRKQERHAEQEEQQRALAGVTETGQPIRKGGETTAGSGLYVQNLASGAAENVSWGAFC